MIIGILHLCFVLFFIWASGFITLVLNYFGLCVDNHRMVASQMLVCARIYLFIYFNRLWFGMVYIEIA